MCCQHPICTVHFLAFVLEVLYRRHRHEPHKGLFRMSRLAVLSGVFVLLCCWPPCRLGLQICLGPGLRQSHAITCHAAPGYLHQKYLTCMYLPYLICPPCLPHLTCPTLVALALREVAPPCLTSASLALLWLALLCPAWPCLSRPFGTPTLLALPWLP